MAEIDLTESVMGDYQMIWRGIIEKGRSNQEFRRFYPLFQQWNLMRRVAKAIDQIDVKTN